jgi:hypothetical protein
MQDSETGKLGKDRTANELAIKKTRIFDIFGGVMKTCVECLGCGFQSITCERYYDFNIVPNPDKEKVMSAFELTP